MNKEKLYNVALSEAFDLVDCAHKTDSHDLVEAFVQGAEWLMAQPLAERLSEEERENIKELHDNFAQLAIRNESTPDKSKGNSMCLLLESVFGKDMFEPKE